MLVTLPFVMLLLDWWPFGRVTGGEWRVAGARSLVVEKIPFFVLSAISCVVTFIVQQKGGAVVELARIPMTGRIENAFVSYARYLGKTLWPAPLANPYPYLGHWEFPLVIYSVALVAGLSQLPFCLPGGFHSSSPAGFGSSGRWFPSSVWSRSATRPWLTATATCR